MTAKEIFESIDLSQLPKEAADKFRKVEKATKGFTIESDKVNTFMRGAYKKIKETKPTALKNLKVEEKITKKEVKKGKTTEVVENLEYKVKGKKKVSKKTPTPSKPKRKGETAMERAKKIRKKDSSGKLEPWNTAFSRAQKELKAEAEKAKKDAEKVVSTTSQALKNLEKMIQNDPKLKGYPRTYGKQSKRIDANKDAKIKAKPAGKRVSKKGHKNQYGESKGGRVYWENRDNRSDRYAPNFPNKVYLQMGGQTDDLGFPTGHTFLVVEVSPSGDKKLIKSTKDYMTALMSSAVARGMKSSKDARVVIVDKEDKKVIHEAFEAGGEITITPTQLINNPDALVGTTTMTELFEAGGITPYQAGGEVFVTPNSLLNAGSADYVAGSNTMSNMFDKGGSVDEPDWELDMDRYNDERDMKNKESGGLVFVYYPDGSYHEIEADSWQEAKAIAEEEGAVDWQFVPEKSNPKGVVFVYYPDGSYHEIEADSWQEAKAIAEEEGAVDWEFRPENLMAKGGFIAMYNGKRVEIDADTLYEAKKKAIKELKVPKSKQGLLSVMANQAMANQDFRFMAKGGKISSSELDKWDELLDNGADVVVYDKNGVKYVYQGSSFEKDGVAVMKGFDESTYRIMPINDVKSIEIGNIYAKGGRLGFEGLAKKVAKRYEGKPVKAKYQDEYGKTYSKEEAMEVGRKVAAKVYGQQQANMKKMAKGGDVDYRYNVTNDVLEDLIGEFGSNVQYRKLDNYTDVYGQKRVLEVVKNRLKDVYNIDSELQPKGKRIGLHILRVPSQVIEYAKGGSLDGHGLQLGDKIVKDLGSVLQIATKDGGMVYVDLASGYRGKDMPLPFAKGGQVYDALSSYSRGLPDDYKKMGFTNRQAAEDFKSLTGLRDSEAKSIYAKLMQNPNDKFAKGGAVGGMKIPDIAKKFGKTTADVMKKLEVGAKHEMEHTTDPKKARKIALDHLSKDLDYYTKLNKLGL